MKVTLNLICMLCTLGLSAQTKGSIPTRYNQQASTEHFVLVWNDWQTNTEEIEEAKAFAEQVYAQLTPILGEANMPKEQLIITFGGEGVDRERRKKRTPHVDLSGRMHLYRFEQGGYLSVLPHEMVHAIRMNSIPRWDGFFEEGFASAIGYYLYPKRAGFPRFGYSIDLVAGYWLASGKGIPMDKLRTQHNGLNLRCQLQTYVAREDFFNYLTVTYGLDKLVDFAYARNVGTEDLYESIWGKSFTELVIDWETDLTNRYNKLENAEVLMNDYFENTSARYIPKCEPGIDY